MRELDRTIARIKLILADLAAREARTESLRVQLQTQLARLPRFILYGNAEAESVLSMMADIEDRLAEIDGDLRRIDLLKRTAEEELETLEITRRIDQQRERLASLHAQAERTGDLSEETRAEIRQLEQSISADSERAAKHILVRRTSSPRTRDTHGTSES
ncbi:MAG: hypothetical protein EPO21_18880 [Chloroflexota bacterium]|nr:MAG: hypothetical protein EPO21_18880 [Chloroflexota bacterium]